MDSDHGKLHGSKTSSRHEGKHIARGTYRNVSCLQVNDASRAKEHQDLNRYNRLSSMTAICLAISACLYESTVSGPAGQLDCFCLVDHRGD